MMAGDPCSVVAECEILASESDHMTWILASDWLVTPDQWWQCEVGGK